tara:strand:+ start:298 stop:795 length:498 start_codon:yes stop_codon:yes gene_type:complete
MIEEFKDIPNHEGLYQVSNLGRVKSLPNKVRFSEKILKPCKNAYGYLVVCLRKDGKTKVRTVHQLVAEAFLNHVPCGFKIIVNHKNFIRHDNRAENLELDTNRNNTNKKHLKSSSEYTGVSWHKNSKKWESNITINGKKKHLGYFTCEIKASEAYENALLNLNYD